MIRAARLDAGLYEELRTAVASNREAIAVVGVVSLASGFGVGFAATVVDGGLGFFGGLLVGVLTSAGGWVIWALWSYWFLAAAFGGPAGQEVYGGMVHRGFMRSLGYANSPRALAFFLFIPFLGWVIAVLASIWALAAGTIAAGEVFDLSRRRAFAICLVGWLPYTLFVSLTAALTI
jgi:hypothetical protein